MQLYEWLALFSVLGTGIVAGIFFAFSNFIMQALARVPDDQGARAMQAINVTVLNPGFFLFFFGSGLIAIAATIAGFMQTTGPSKWWLLAGTLSYILGCVGTTIAFNVPLNDRLEKLDAASDEAASLWALYLVQWTRWNTARTAASAASTVLFTLAIS
jgi:uncharacterized membrane protein